MCVPAGPAAGRNIANHDDGELYGTHIPTATYAEIDENGGGTTTHDLAFHNNHRYEDVAAASSATYDLTHADSKPGHVNKGHIDATQENAYDLQAPTAAQPTKARKTQALNQRTAVSVCVLAFRC